MADDFDKKNIIAKLRAQGIPDKDIEKLYGKLPPKPSGDDGIPFMITQAMKAELKRRGYNDADIRGLTPKVAHDILNGHPSTQKQTKTLKANAWKYDNKHKRPVRQEDKDADYEPIEELRAKTKKPRISKKKPKLKTKKPKADWNTTSEARLKALYEAGYSNEEMANEFKTTKDAITGKLSRLRAAGWKGTIGTTHNPIPSPSSQPQAVNRKLSPSMKRFLASALETNFGAVGRFFSRKWGLIDDKKSLGKGGGSAEVTAAVIKSNQEVISALTKLDTALRRGTSVLTKSVATSTSKMTDAINNAVELVKKNTPTEGGGGGIGGAGGGKAGGGAAGMGAIAALLGGAGLAMLMGSRSEASVNTSDQIGADEVDPQQVPEDAPNDKDSVTPKLEINTKELTFEADEITFEADEFKFDSKRNGAASSSTGGGGASKPPSAGFFNDLMDKMIGGRGGGGYAGGGGMDGQGGGPAAPGGLPSDADLDKKDKSWFGGKSSGGPTGPAGSSGGKAATGNQAERIKTAMAAMKEQLRTDGVPEANLDAAAAHLVGQSLSESHLEPNTSHDNGTGYGIYGARNERRTAMLDWLKKNGFAQNSLEGQAKFMAHEAMTNPRFKATRDALMGANEGNHDQTARIITHNFEGPKVENWRDRADNARKALKTQQAQQASLDPDAKGGSPNASKVAPEDADKNPAIRITPDVFKSGAAPVSPWTNDPKMESMDGSDVIDAKNQMQPSNANSGATLNGAQKEQDDQPANFNERFSPNSSDKRSDASDDKASFQTSILETTGPSHFLDYEGLRGTGGDSWQTNDA